MKEDEFGTHGELLTAEGKRICYTIERPYLDNQRKISCIPDGIYVCAPYSSLKHPSTWEVCFVNGRDHILFHSGNTMNDSEGCIIVGTFSSKTGVTMSKNAMAKLHEVLPPHFILEVRRNL